MEEWERRVGRWDDPFPDLSLPDSSNGNNNINSSNRSSNGESNPSRGKNKSGEDAANTRPSESRTVITTNGGASQDVAGKGPHSNGNSKEQPVFVNDDDDSFTVVGGRKPHRNRTQTKAHASDPTIYKYPVILQDDGTGTDCYKNYGIDTNRLWTKAKVGAIKCQRECGGRRIIEMLLERAAASYQPNNNS
jgi:hypothetical protein